MFSQGLDVPNAMMALAFAIVKSSMVNTVSTELTSESPEAANVEPYQNISAFLCQRGILRTEVEGSPVVKTMLASEMPKKIPA